jgi:alpha-beta hydrolase superfamily lysophospholipase
MPRLRFFYLVVLAIMALAAFAPLVLAQEQATYPRADGADIEARVLPAPGCAPLAIISHGLGGNARGNAQLASALNRAGYRVIVPSHAESGPRLLFGAMTEGRAGLARSASDRRLLQLRLDDITAILESENRRCAVPFRVLAGHSMGARTASIEAGARTSTGISGRDRFDAYVLVSPLGEGSSFLPRGGYGGITKPVLMVTGTRDQSVDGSWETRLSAFDGLAPGRKRLAIIEEAGHIALGGRDGRVGGMVGTLSVEFLRAIQPGPWRAAPKREGISFAEK